MNFLQYKDAYDMMRQTGLSASECRRLVKSELEKMINEGENKHESKPKQGIES